MATRLLLIVACVIGLSTGTLPGGGFGAGPRGIPGGWWPLDTNSPLAWQLAWFIASNVCPNCQVVSIPSAMKQVVAGMNYRLVVRINKISAIGLPYAFMKCTAQIYVDLAGIRLITDGPDCVYVPILVTRGGAGGRLGKKPF